MRDKTRRDLVASIGTLGIAGLAGCATNTNPESTSTSTPTQTDTPTETPETTEPEEPKDDRWQPVPRSYDGPASTYSISEYNGDFPSPPHISEIEYRNVDGDVGFRFHFESPFPENQSPRRILVKPQYSGSDFGIWLHDHDFSDPVELYVDQTPEDYVIVYEDDIGEYWSLSINVSSTGEIEHLAFLTVPLRKKRVREGGNPYLTEQYEGVSVPDDPAGVWDTSLHLFPPDEAALRIQMGRSALEGVSHIAMYAGEAVNPALDEYEWVPVEEDSLTVETQVQQAPVNFVVVASEKEGFDDPEFAWVVEVSLDEYGLVDHTRSHPRSEFE